MVQARGIQIRQNVRNMGVQVLEQMVRSAYNVNGTGMNALKNREHTTNVPIQHPVRKWRRYILLRPTGNSNVLQEDSLANSFNILCTAI